MNIDQIPPDAASAKPDLHDEHGPGKNQRHGIRDDHRPGVNEDSVNQPQADSRTEHEIHAQADIFRAAMFQRPQYLREISNGSQGSGNISDGSGGCGHWGSLPYHRWTRPEASPFSSAFTSSTLERVKSPGIECFRQLAATANSSAS